METITKRQRIAGSIPNFIQQYLGSSFDRTKEIDLLRQLDPATCSAKDVDDIIGNNSWTVLNCGECKQPVETAMYIGERPHNDYDNGAILCISCLKEAVRKLEKLEGL